VPFLSVGIELAPGLDPGSVEAACFDAGALAVTLSDMRDDPVLEPAPGEVRLWPATRLCALFSAERASAQLIAALGAVLGVTAERIEVAAVEDRVWEREWLAGFHAMRFGRRLWIAPSHEPVSAPGAVVVELDPGLAFGTGTHPTTALCLEWLDAHPPEDTTVIDYGCGSGILAIAAARLGASAAYAWDIDPQAHIATRDNAQRNRVATIVRLAAAEADLPRGADLLLANILAAPLIELAPRFAQLVRPDGAVVLSGLLDENADAVTAACAPWFDTRVFSGRDGWICLAGVRRVHDLP
jgi:ribosomal protein L11 methyltransferase